MNATAATNLIVIPQDQLESFIFQAVAKSLKELLPALTPTETKGGESLLTMKSLCSELSLSRARINQMIKAGTLTPERLPGSRRIFFKRSAIIKAFEKTKVKK